MNNSNIVISRFFKLVKLKYTESFLVLRVLQSGFSYTKFGQNSMPDTVRTNFIEKICYVMLQQKSSSHLLAGRDFC